MSFGGGGGGALPNHEHTNIALDGGPLSFLNTTVASLSANSMTYSDGAALQELTIGGEGSAMTVSGGVPTWAAAGPAGDVLSAILVMANSTTIGDYTQPASATCSSAASSGTATVTITGVFGYNHSLYNGSQIRGGEEFNVDAALRGQTVSEISAWLKKTGSPTGLGYFRAYDSGGALVATFGSVDVATFTGSYVEYSSGTGATRILATGDKLVFEYSGGDASNNVQMEVAATCLYDCPGATRTRQTDYSVAGGWSTNNTNDYHMSFTYENFPNPCSNAVDDNTATYWQSATETNPNIYVDLSSSTTCSNIGIDPNSATTETEVTIQSSDDAVSWTTQRTILTSNWTNGAWNYIRFNLATARYWRIYGNSGNSVDLAINEIKVLNGVSDANVRTLHGHIPISSSDTSLNNAGV